MNRLPRYSEGYDGVYEDKKGDLVDYSVVRKDIITLCEIILGEYPESDDRYIIAEKIKNEYINL